jgi:hypothetical protein
MDTLALLCNLHADGPATLAKLRASGCRTLGELENLPQRALAHVLGGNAERARRFLREAALLGGRVESTPLEHAVGAHAAASNSAPRERAPNSTDPSPASAAHATDEVAGPFSSVPDAADPFAAGTVAIAQGERRERYAMQPLKDAVLRVWSEQDRLDPPHAIERAPTAPRRGETPGDDTGDGLAALDGCDAPARKTLAAAGVTSAAEFLARDAVALAAETGLAYTALSRWSFLLRHRTRAHRHAPR